MRRNTLDTEGRYGPEPMYRLWGTVALILLTLGVAWGVIP